MLFKILGILADILAVLSLWGIGEESSIALRIICTIVIILFAILACLKDHYTENVVDYFWAEDELPTLFVKKNVYFKDNALVSVYMREDNNKSLVAIGFVICENEDNDKQIQIKVFKYINDSAMRKIKINKKCYKKFLVKPDVRYSDISDIDFRET